MSGEEKKNREEKYFLLKNKMDRIYIYTITHLDSM